MLILIGKGNEVKSGEHTSEQVLSGVSVLHWMQLASFPQGTHLLPLLEGGVPNLLLHCKSFVDLQVEKKR